MRHPCERGAYRTLGQVVLTAVRLAFDAPAHPDSKRQARRKARCLTRYGARVLKRSGVLNAPVQRTNNRREFRDIQRRLAEQRKAFAASVAKRLLGKKF